MSEYFILWTAAGTLLGLTVSSTLYALGGRSGKWKRRFVASAVLAGTVNVASVVMGVWNVFQLLAFPALVLGFSMGYGAETEGMKWVRRSIYAMCISLAGLAFYFTLGVSMKTNLILMMQLSGALVSIVLGVQNPVYAAAEEVFVCMYLNLALCMYPFVAK